MTSKDGMSEIVHNRFKEVCPVECISEKDIIEVKDDVNVGFEIIGYLPKNLDKAFQKAWESCDGETLLSDFIFEVWRLDDG